jgi:hypothetical protein
VKQLEVRKLGRVVEPWKQNYKTQFNAEVFNAVLIITPNDVEEGKTQIG